ncbi:MAG: hypothetical protein ACFCU2_08410 [Acidimicrobiia bacterium]
MGWDKPARADFIPEVSATIDEPSPNPTPAGSTASTSAQFNLSGDTGPIRVQIQLQAASGFGQLRLDAAATSSELDCTEFATSVICNWDGDSINSPQTLAVFVDVDSSVLPYSGAQLLAIAESPTATPETYSSTFMYSAPPVGTTSLAGMVVTDDGVPVNQACIFILSSPSFVFPGITDATGAWNVSGLPDTYSFAVAVVPPFNGAFGPCADSGPPPVPADGELQPVFVGDVWIDLSDPLLTGGLGDPYDFAVAAGATVFTSSAAGLEACLTDAPGSQVPRPPCIAQVTTTTQQPTTTTSTGVSGTDVTTTSEVTFDTLPLTGANAAVFVGIAGIMVLVGLAILGAGGRETRG